MLFQKGRQKCENIKILGMIFINDRTCQFYSNILVLRDKNGVHVWTNHEARSRGGRFLMGPSLPVVSNLWTRFHSLSLHLKLWGTVGLFCMSYMHGSVIPTLPLMTFRHVQIRHVGIVGSAQTLRHVLWWRFPYEIDKFLSRLRKQKETFRETCGS